MEVLCAWLGDSANLPKVGMIMVGVAGPASLNCLSLGPRWAGTLHDFNGDGREDTHGITAFLI